MAGWVTIGVANGAFSEKIGATKGSTTLMRGTLSLSADTRGVTAVEFAILSPVLMLMLIGILEFALVFFSQQVMENVSYNVSRLGKTGFVDTDMTQEQTIRAMLAERLEGLIDIDTVGIQTTTYGQFSDIDANEPFIDANENGVRDDGENYTDLNGNGQYDGALAVTGYGQSGQITVYQITVPWRVFTPVLSHMIGDGNGNIVLESRVVVRNEPYSEDDGA